MELTNENYYSNEADRQYMSISQFKSFMQCEAAAMAKLQGKYKESDNASLLVGSYFHSHFDGTAGQFKNEHPEMFSTRGKTKGLLKAEYSQANDMINCLETDEGFKQLYQGKTEVPITFRLYGVEWKAKIDLLNLEKNYFIDLKTAKDFEKVWDDELHLKVNFIQSRGYNLQMAVYREGIREFFKTGDMDAYIIAVTKQTPPAKRIFRFEPESYEKALAVVEANLPHVIAVKEGREEPKRCGKCEYCRMTENLKDNIYTFEDVELI